MKIKILCVFLFLFLYSTANSQSLSLFDVDASNYPTIKAKFFAFDKDGKQITNLIPTDFELTENEDERSVTIVSCPPLMSPKNVSIAMSIDVSGSMISSSFGDIPVELGKTTAKELCNLIPMPPSEFALQTCDNKALIIQDFTTNRSKILSAIEPIIAGGGNDFVEHLLNGMTGLLNIAKKGKNQRVAVLYTDAWWKALSFDELKKCKDTCNKCNIQFFAVFYSRPESDTNGIKKSLKELAYYTGGMVFDGITSTEAAKEIGLILQQTAQSSAPCEIEWQSEVSCFAGITNVELQIPNLAITLNGSYQSPITFVTKLEFNPPSVKFENPTPGVYAQPQTVTVTALNADFTVNNITAKIPVGFDITPKSFSLKAGDSIVLTVTYFPADSGYNYCRFDAESEPCLTKFYVSGGWKGKKPTIRTIKLIHPNGGEVFVVGSDKVITWEGVSPDESVKIDYSIDNGVNWLTIADSAKGLSYNWRVPQTPSEQCLVSVTATANSKPAPDIEMLLIPAGTFQMGNTGAYTGYDDEKPVHTVNLSRDFLMSKYEITQKQYEEVMGTNPSNFIGENLPVETVSWFDAVEFCNKLSDLESLELCYSGSGDSIKCDWNANGYRLPTEAEWEYSCKAGTTTDIYNGNLTYMDTFPIDSSLNRIGWYGANGSLKTNMVGQKEPNAFGLYDMSGNVWEWCWDWPSSYSTAIETDPVGHPSGYRRRTCRGGCWTTVALACRSSSRSLNDPDRRSRVLGFRIVSLK